MVMGFEREEKENPSSIFKIEKSFFPSVFVFAFGVCVTSIQCCGSWVLVRKSSFVSYHSGAAVAVVQVVPEAHHAAGARVVGADSAKVAVDCCYP